MSQKANLKFLKNLFLAIKILQSIINVKADLDEIYDNIAEGVKIRSKCQWYEENEKSIKYFLNLEKKHAENLSYEDQ